MKKVYIDIIQNHTAWSRKMYCPYCGAHEYNIVEQVEPKAPEPFPISLWYIQCPQCGAESSLAPSRKAAIAWWKMQC